MEVEEVEKCTYHMTVATPLACEEHMEAASTQRLEELGVFGFAGGGGGGGAGEKSKKHPQLSASAGTATATASDIGVDGIAIVSRH